MPELPQLGNENGTAAAQAAAKKPTRTAAGRRMRQLERAGKVDPSSPSGAVLFAGDNKDPKTGALSVSFAAPNVGIEIRADAILDVVRAELLELLRANIEAGLDPDGRPQPPLSARALRAKGRKSRFRGYASGVLASGLRSPKMTGTTANAKARILPPTSRNAAVAQAAKFGVTFIGIGPAHEAAIQQITDAFVDKALADAAGLRDVVMVPRDGERGPGEG